MTKPKTEIDWLRFRTQAEPRDIVSALDPVFGAYKEREGPALKLHLLPRGMLGFEQAAEIHFFDVPVGRMDYGGASQRGWVRVEITGGGCQWIDDWDGVAGILVALGGEIRRLDIALTTTKGEIRHDDILKAHADGRFATGGRPPHLQMVTSTDPQAGRTCYIGSRKGADRFLRCYEKGRQLAGQHAIYPETVLGGLVDDVYRVEVEFKAENRPICIDSIMERDLYFAAAYPFCRDILPSAEVVDLPKRRERQKQEELEKVLGFVKHQFGKTLYTALRLYDGDIGLLMSKIVGQVDNPVLMAKGVGLVPHAVVRQAVKAGTGVQPQVATRQQTKQPAAAI